MTTRARNVRATKAKAAVVMLAVVLGGCSLVPYEEHFACEGRDEFGRCTSVDGAYQEALTGQPQGPKIKRARDSSSGKEDDFGADPDGKATTSGTTPADAAYSSYKKALYKKLTRLLEEPETPMVKQPTVIRALVLTYKTSGRGTPLFMPRYVFFFGDEPTWVLGEQEEGSPRAPMPFAVKELTK